MVKRLVRLALAYEYQRKTIRRADISEKVLGTAGRQFKRVFEQAQQELRAVFGMEMVELPAREKVTVQQRRGACLQLLFSFIRDMDLTSHSRSESRQAENHHSLLDPHLHPP
jgi:hypothetical protein